MRVLSLIISLFLITTVDVFPQRKTDANIKGHVTSNNSSIPYATISLRGTAIGVNTDEKGQYNIVNLPEGTYTVRAQSVGYKPSEKEITVRKNQTLEVDFDLSEDLLGLEEVVVTADRSEMKRIESVTIVNTVSPKIFASSQAVTLSEGLTFSPGLRIENNCQNCGFSQIRMNGLEGPYSQILINSRPIFSGLAGVYGLELIPANMIEKVEVVKGGGSALYGSNAIAGTINIILKEPESNSYEASLNSGLTGVGTTGKAVFDNSANFNTSVVFNDAQSGMSFYGFTRDRKMFDANGDGYSEIAPMTNMTLGARIFHRLTVRGKFSMDLFTIKEDRNGGNKQDFPLHERDVAEAVKHNINTGVAVYEQYFRKYDLLTAYISAQGLSRDSYYGANHSLKDYGRSTDLTYNAGIQYKAFLGNNSYLIAGVEKTGGALVDKKLGYPDYENAVIVNDSIVSVPHTENTIVSDQSSDSYGAFFQYDLKVNKLRLGLGGRIDNYAVTDNTGDTEKKSGTIFSPRVSLMYEVMKSVQARVSYSHGYRAPQIFDEDLHIETSGARKVINKNDPLLIQETSNSYMASIDFNGLIGTVMTGFLVEAFYTRLNNPFRNEIGEPNEKGEVIYTRKNAEDGAAVRGLNLELNIRPLRDFSLASGFTFQRSMYGDEQEFGTRSFFRAPSDYGYINADWDFLDDFCFSANAIYTGRMLVPYFGPLSATEDGELRKSGSFIDVGSKLSYNIKLSGSVVQLSAGIKNIFNSYQADFDSGINRDPSYIYGPVQPRTIYFGIKIGNRIL